MTTQQATTELARIWQLGGFSDAAMAIERCKSASRDWRWNDANQAMREAYSALGADAPQAGIRDIHCGRHPVQVAAEKL